MKKRIIIAVILIIAIAIILNVMEVQARKQSFEEFCEVVESTAQFTADCTRRAIAENRANALVTKEKQQDTIREKYTQRHIRAEEKRKEAERLEAERRERERQANRTTANYSGGHLTRYNGVYYFGNQRETYYNLDMSVIVSVAHRNGIGGEYWIREDGCKMLGDYIMLACNRSVHPYGSIVLTSLGYGISLDTGGFAYTYPYGVDIATNW